MRQLAYERRIQLLALAAGFPGSLIAMILLWHGNYSSGTVWTLAFLIFSLWLGFAFSLRHRVVFSLQTLSNLLAALREEDFSLRARGGRSDDAMGEVIIEVNARSEVLRQQRLGAMEANALLRTVWRRLAWPSVLSTTTRSCGWSIAPANVCWVARKSACWGLPRKNWGWALAWKARPRTRWSWLFPAVPGAGGCDAGPSDKEGCLITW